MAFFLIFDIDKNIIQIYNDEDIKFLYKNPVNIALEYCQSIGQSKRYYQILEMTISGPENCFLLIIFVNSHLVIDTCKIELGKLPSLSQPILKIFQQKTVDTSF